MKTFIDFLLWVAIVWVVVFIFFGNVYLCTEYTLNLWTGAALMATDITIVLFIVFITFKIYKN